MIVLDANILIASLRADHPHHPRVRPWFDDLVTRGARFAVPDLVWVAVVRVCTNRRVFPTPSGIDDVTAFAHAVIAQPGYVPIHGLRDGIREFLETAKDADAAANLATDAYIAAMALSWGAAVVSLDRDFRRFDGLRVIEPTLSA